MFNYKPSPIDLGPYLQYSDDPSISSGIVIGGQDRLPPATEPQAAIWSGAWTVIPDPSNGCQWSVALGGKSDRLVGYVVPLSAERSATQAALWVFNSGAWLLTELPISANVSWSQAIAMNGAGNRISGQVGDIRGGTHAAVWSEVRPMSWAMEQLPQADSSAFAVGVDDVSGDVIGAMLDTTKTWRVVRWQLVSGAWTITQSPGAANATPSAYCDAVVVGYFTAPDGTNQAATWDATGQMLDLGIGPNTLARGHFGGVVVGTYAFDPNTGKGKGFVWTASQGMSDIHPPGWEWSIPTAIDASGWIVGVMGQGNPRDPTAEKRIYLLKPS